MLINLCKKLQNFIVGNEHNAPFSAPIYIFADEVYPHIKSHILYKTNEGVQLLR